MFMVNKALGGLERRGPFEFNKSYLKIKRNYNVKRKFMYNLNTRRTIIGNVFFFGIVSYANRSS